MFWIILWIVIIVIVLFSVGVATIGNSQHFMTFDGRHFDFAGMCSYVLARDVVDKNFTVIMNYNRNRRNPKIKSLQVLAEGKNIELMDDYKVQYFLLLYSASLSIQASPFYYIVHPHLSIQASLNQASPIWIIHLLGHMFCNQ